jgi:hypothetical protein
MRVVGKCVVWIPSGWAIAAHHLPWILHVILPTEFPAVIISLALSFKNQYTSVTFVFSSCNKTFTWLHDNRQHLSRANKKFVVSTLCSLVNEYHCFGETCCHLLNFLTYIFWVYQFPKYWLNSHRSKQITRSKCIWGVLQLWNLFLYLMFWMIFTHLTLKAWIMRLI